MKARFAPDGLRVRVDRPEFERLRQGEPLALDCAGAVRVEVHRGDRLRIESAAGLVRLHLPGDALEALAGRLPAREGIEGTVERSGRPLQVAFEVDIRSTGPRPPR